MNNSRKRRRDNHMQDPGRGGTADTNQHVQGQSPKKKRPCGLSISENGDEFIEHGDLHLIKRLVDIPRLEDQVKMLIQNLRPNGNDQFPKYGKICKDIYEILLYNSYPHCVVYPFGSTVTGLYFDNSDVDVFIAGMKKQDGEDKKYLYRLKYFLLNSHLFSDIFVIGRAKVPILRCVHIETGIKCDITCKNMLGVCNSKLIKYYLNLDPKVKNLMLVLKYWAKVHKIVGQNLFSNYSISMMLIFFLQQEPYNLPSVLSLQHDSYYDHLHDGWNGGFDRIHVDTASLADTSLLKLMRGFFTFYVAFEYGINIICPYLGKAVRKDEFKNPETLPNYFNSYKKCTKDGVMLKVDTSICIQDPFEHTRNTTPVVLNCTLNTFVSFCRQGIILCDENENKSSLLYNILMASPSSILQTYPNYESEIEESAYFGCHVPMNDCLKYIEEKIVGCSNRQDAFEEAWFKSVGEFTTIVLKDFLKFDVTELHESASKPKYSKQCDDFPDVLPRVPINQVSYRCVGKMNLWGGRNSAKKKCDADQKIKHDIISREVAITDHLYNPYLGLPHRPNIINFEITLEHYLKPTAVFVHGYKTKAYKNTFNSFARFFSENLPSWFETYEKEQNLQRT